MPTRTNTPPILVTRELIERRKKERARARQASFSKGGILMLVIVIVVLFTAVHARANQMMYVALIFAFLAIALFTYGFWSSVSKGEGVWQYIGKHNLQHQQLTNPAYHYNDSVIDFKNQPGSRVHVIAPPKMGGVRLQIYTLDDDEPLRDLTPALSQSSLSSDSHRHKHHHRHHHHKRHHRHHRHHQQQLEQPEQQLHKSGGEFTNILESAEEHPSQTPVEPSNSCKLFPDGSHSNHQIHLTSSSSSSIVTLKTPADIASTSITTTPAASSSGLENATTIIVSSTDTVISTSTSTTATTSITSATGIDSTPKSDLTPMNIQR